MTVKLSAIEYRVWKEDTYTRGSAEIKQHLTLLQKAILFVQLDEFECGSGTISLFFCKFVPFIQTAFAMLLLDCHGTDIGWRAEKW